MSHQPRDGGWGHASLHQMSCERLTPPQNGVLDRPLRRTLMEPRPSLAPTTAFLSKTVEYPPRRGYYHGNPGVRH
jgi:hypothetical protein